MNFWIKFTDGYAGSCSATDEQAARDKAISETGKDIESVKVLPYPARPIIGECAVPAFCYTPTQCAGNTSCPKRYSCVE